LIATVDGTAMVVPWSGADWTSSRPPRAASRAAMFRRPEPSGVWRRLIWQQLPEPRLGQHELKTQPVPHAAQAFLIERTVRDPHTGELHCAAAALGTTSRGPERGGTPEVIATAARGYWDIEALHHVRDTTLDEDASGSARVIRPGHGSHQEAVPFLRADMCRSAPGGTFRRTDASTSP
jgi:hypothetical protein